MRRRLKLSKYMYQWIFTKLGVCIILWRSDLGLLMGRCFQFLTELSVCLTLVSPSMFLFPDDNLSKYQWIFTKLMCVDILEIWFWIANGQILSTLAFICRPQLVAGYYTHFGSCFYTPLPSPAYDVWGVYCFELVRDTVIPGFHQSDFVSTQYLEKEWMELTKICICINIDHI